MSIRLIVNNLIKPQGELRRRYCLSKRPISRTKISEMAREELVGLARTHQVVAKRDMVPTIINLKRCKVATTEMVRWTLI